MGHIRAILAFTVDGGGGGLGCGVKENLDSPSVPSVVSAWLYIACKYEYGFSLSYSWEFGAKHSSQTENHTLDARNFIQGAFKDNVLFRWQQVNLVGNPIKI